MIFQEDQDQLERAQVGAGELGHHLLEDVLRSHLLGGLHQQFCDFATVEVQEFLALRVQLEYLEEGYLLEVGVQVVELGDDQVDALVPQK